MSDRSVDTEGATVGAYEPPFGASQGVGPAGEAIEYIGLGSKTPRHRKFSSGMLKSAMRSSSRVNSCVNLPDTVSSRSRSESRASHRSDNRSPTRPSRSGVDEHGRVAQHYEQPSSSTHTSGTRRTVERNSSTRSRNGRSASTLPFSSNIFSLGRVHSRHSSQPVPGPSHAAASHATDQLAPAPHHQTRGRQHRESFSSTHSQSAGALRSILGNLSLEQRRHPSDPPDLLKPADDLHSYLSNVEYVNWAKWPPLPNRGIFGTRNKGFDAMGWEWRRRLQDAEQGRGYRALRMWDVNKGFEREVLQCELKKAPGSCS